MKTQPKEVLRNIWVDRIVPNPQQPRIVFDQTELEELAASIKVHGVIEPIVVEEAANNSFILHDGERRWCASKLVGLKRIKAIVQPPLNGTGPRERLERSLVANVQRSNMHRVEQAYAFKRLMDEFGYSIHEVARRTGKAYTHVYDILQLLQLEPEILELMLARKIRNSQSNVVKAFLSVPAGEERITLARALGEKNAEASTIIHACSTWNRMRNAGKAKQKGKPLAQSLVSSRLENPEWDALHQVGKVPPWKLFMASVVSTCDSCALRNIASQAICGDCPLVAFVRTTMEAVEHAH